MEIPLQLIILSLPSLVYLAIQRWRGAAWSEGLRRVGWRPAPLVSLLWSVGVVAVVGGLAWLAFQALPPGALDNPNVNTSAYRSLRLSPLSFLTVWAREAVYVALGEEVFFRGLLGGWLIRRLGFGRGNAVQALVFLLPHLLLLTVSLSVWPLLLAQLAAGWLMGWLRYRFDSILPGWFAHSLTNALGALSAMQP